MQNEKGSKEYQKYYCIHLNNEPNIYIVINYICRLTLCAIKYPWNVFVTGCKKFENPCFKGMHYCTWSCSH